MEAKFDFTSKLGFDPEAIRAMPGYINHRVDLNNTNQILIVRGVAQVDLDTVMASYNHSAHTNATNSRNKQPRRDKALADLGYVERDPLPALWNKVMRNDSVEANKIHTEIIKIEGQIP